MKNLKITIIYRFIMKKILKNIIMTTTITVIMAIIIKWSKKETAD